MACFQEGYIYIFFIGFVTVNVQINASYITQRVKVHCVKIQTVLRTLLKYS